MKKILYSMIAIACLAGLFMTGCSALGFTTGSGPIVNKVYDFAGFNAVEVSNNFEYNIVQSQDYRVVVSTHENIVSHLDVYQTGKTVHIGLNSGSYYNTDAKVEIGLPLLDNLIVSGATHGNVQAVQPGVDCQLKVSGASRLNVDLATGAAVVNVSGASKVTGKLNAQDTRISVSGASTYEVSGSAGAVTAEISGASQMKTPEFAMASADVNVSGASRATVNTRGTLNLDVSGASTLNYLGNPVLSRVNVTGASHISAK
jgi:hypothetical protein